MEQISDTIREAMKDEKKRGIIVGAGIAVAAIIAGTITLTTYMREKKKKM